MAHSGGWGKGAAALSPQNFKRGEEKGGKGEKYERKKEKRGKNKYHFLREGRPQYTVVTCNPPERVGR